jgi:hypothetical protein
MGLSVTTGRIASVDPGLAPPEKMLPREIRKNPEF